MITAMEKGRKCKEDLTLNWEKGKVLSMWDPLSTPRAVLNRELGRSSNLPSLPVLRVDYPFFTISTRLPIFNISTRFGNSDFQKYFVVFLPVNVGEIYFDSAAVRCLRDCDFF